MFDIWRYTDLLRSCHLTAWTLHMHSEDPGLPDVTTVRGSCMCVLDHLCLLALLGNKEVPLTDTKPPASLLERTPRQDLVGSHIGSSIALHGGEKPRTVFPQPSGAAFWKKHRSAQELRFASLGYMCFWQFLAPGSVTTGNVPLAQSQVHTCVY
jgi:hypothetical protein